MLPALLLLLFLTDGAQLEDVCSYHDIIQHLNLTKDNELFQFTRPVRDHRVPTMVTLELALYAILDVDEKEQRFIPFIWTYITWKNDYISWDKDQFCGITNISIPSELLWKPDLTIEEMTEKDKSPPSPYLTIANNGIVEVQSNQMVVCTCGLHIYKFPFDTQNCNLTFRSIIHEAKDILLRAGDNSSEATEWTREVMRSQYEWRFDKMIITRMSAINQSMNQDQLIYTIVMTRSPLLYIVNFLLPVMFFLALDMASYMISNADGSKVSFQVTVMLAITVLQLLLCEILPSASDRVPLIAVYCIGTFALMMLSLLETIVVMYLLRQDTNDEKRDGIHGEDCAMQSNSNYRNCYGEITNWTRCPSIYKTHAGETHSEVPAAIEDSNKQAEEYHTLEKLSEELRGVERTLSQLNNNHKQDKSPGYWYRLAKTFNRAFFCFYVCLVVTFLVYIYVQWTR